MNYNLTLDTLYIAVYILYIYNTVVFFIGSFEFFLHLCQHVLHAPYLEDKNNFIEVITEQNIQLF